MDSEELIISGRPAGHFRQPGPRVTELLVRRPRNGPRAARSGQRAEPAVTELDRLAMNSPLGSAVPIRARWTLSRLGLGGPGNLNSAVPVRDGDRQPRPESSQVNRPARTPARCHAEDGSSHEPERLGLVGCAPAGAANVSEPSLSFSSSGPAGNLKAVGAPPSQ
jgi:hypothetical protein